MRRTALSLIAIAGTLVLAACADTTAPSPQPAMKTANHISDSRYMLASGDYPPPGCVDVGGGWWYCSSQTVE